MGLVLLLAACAPVAPPRAPAGPADAPERQGPPKRIVAAIMDEPSVLSAQLAPPSARGIDAVEELVHAGMATIDRQGALRVQLAEDIPTIENGLWKVHPDGRMEMTWRIKPGALARWDSGHCRRLSVHAAPKEMCPP